MMMLNTLRDSVLSVIGGGVENHFRSVKKLMYRKSAQSHVLIM